MNRAGDDTMLLRPWACSIFCFLAMACSETRLEKAGYITSPSAQTTFEKFLLKAEHGDAKAQNLIGYMLYFGEGVARDRVQAHFWFERAAIQAYPGAQLNLAVMLYTGADISRDPEAAAQHYKKWRAISGSSLGEEHSRTKTLAETIKRLRNLEPGPHAQAQADFERFCAGCHGLNGIAAYVGSPSFAIGERLHKEDRTLLASVKTGHSIMPAWEDLLDDAKQKAVLEYIRTFPDRFKMGIALPLRDPPQQYFTFGPMQNTPFAR